MHNLYKMLKCTSTIALWWMNNSFDRTHKYAILSLSNSQWIDTQFYAKSIQNRCGNCLLCAFSFAKNFNKTYHFIWIVWIISTRFNNINSIQSCNSPKYWLHLNKMRNIHRLNRIACLRDEWYQCNRNHRKKLYTITTNRSNPAWFER